MRLALALALVLLAAPAVASPDANRYAVITTGTQIDATSVHNFPGVTDSFTTVAVPTLGARLWGGRKMPVTLGLHFDGLVAKIFHLSDAPRLQPFLGADTGITFPLFGGRISLGGVIEIHDIQQPMIALGEGATDVGGQLRYTHPFAGRARLGVMLQVGASGADNNTHDKGSFAGASAEVLVKLSKRLSVYASFQEDVRTYKDDTIPHGEFSFVTSMFRFGLALHNLGPFGSNDYF